MTPLPCETPATGPAAALADRIAALVPVLETGRLRLRPARIGDFAAYADIACSARGAGLGGPMSRDDAWYDFANMVAGWLLRGHGLWAVDLRDGDLAGIVNIGFEPGDLEPELGYAFTAGAEGKGFAAEAARAARAFAFDALKLPSLVSYVFAANTRSIALAKRIGARQDGEVMYPGDPAPSIVFRQPRPGNA